MKEVRKQGYTLHDSTHMMFLKRHNFMSCNRRLMIPEKKNFQKKLQGLNIDQLLPGASSRRWRGRLQRNMRELDRAMESFCILTVGAVIELCQLPKHTELYILNIIMCTIPQFKINMPMFLE